MNIALDYDDTYTLHPEMWDKVIQMMRRCGHKVYVVTWRFPGECNKVYTQLGDKVDGIYPTCRKAKEKFMFNEGICINVWIDDNPHCILHTMEGF